MKLFVIGLFLGVFSPCLGREWAQVTLSDSSTNMPAATWSPNGSIALLCLGPTVRRSVNFGVSWTQVFLTPDGSSLYGIASRTITPNGITYHMAVDDARWTYASDGTGQRWGRVGENLRAAAVLYGTSIGSNGFAFTVGASGCVRRASYTDNFTSWTDYKVSTPTWYDVSTSDGINVIIVGVGGASYYSNSGGNSWFAGTTGTSYDIFCVSHANGSAVFAMAAGANGYLSKTEDGGLTWTNMSAFPSTYIARYKSISVLSTTEAYVAAQSLSINPKGIIYRTLDGGSNWVVMSSVSNPLNSLSMYNSDYGVAGVTAGTVVYTLVAGEI
ncbi:hypothetical protein EON65_34315 [archaeon]|nr:MAG: hypothetical protein EON65_34315 [archaeon]